jgi:hypothetical protein
MIANLATQRTFSPDFSKLGSADMFDGVQWVVSDEYFVLQSQAPMENSSICEQTG